MATSYIDELVNSNVSDLSSKLSSVSTTDISKLEIGSSVSSDKIFSAVSKSESTSNVFGVFDSKQVVQELSADTSSAFSTELIDDLDPEKLKNMSTKVGSEITTDLDLESAVSDIMSNVSDLKQQGLSAAGDLFGETVTVVTSTGAEIQATLLENVSLDPNISSLIPSSMSISDFSSLKSFFNDSSGLGNFNTCDALAAALGFASSLIDINALFKAISGLFGILGQYDITGIINCIQQALGSLDVAQTTDISSMLIDNGAVGSYSEFTSIGNNGSVLDAYSTVQQIGSASSGTNTSALDTIYSNLGINKEDTFSESYLDTSGNESILDSISEPVYNRTDIIEASDNGFAEYCLGTSTPSLLSAIPDSLFS